MLSRSLARQSRLATPMLSRAMASASSSEGASKYGRLFVPSSEEAKSYKDDYEHTQEHNKGTAAFWKKIFFFGCVPAMVAVSVSTYIQEKKHFDHLAAHPRPSDDELPPEYEYQNVRATKFFWGDGDKTLFWNDKVNHHKKD